MTKSIFALLLLLSLTASGPAYTQDSLHCIPISESRLLHEDALKKRSMDSMLVNREARIIHLEKQNQIQHKEFKYLIGLEGVKLQYQKEVTQHTEGLVDSYKTQSAYYQKQEKKRRRERNGLGVLLVILVVISL